MHAFSSLSRYFYLNGFHVINFRQRFRVDAFLVNTLIVFGYICVDKRPKCIQMYPFLNENAFTVDKARVARSALADQF